MLLPPATSAAPPPATTHRAESLVRGLWVLWLTFVVYGSLVPLQFQALPWEQAVAHFMRLPMLQAGVEGRADWVANGVLYVPVGFLTACLLARSGRAPGLLAGLAAAVAGIGLAVAVEFTQLYFPPRTVSLNDLLAEALGTVLGVVLAWRSRDGIQAVDSVLRGHWRAVGSALAPAGAMAVLLIGLFPYDLLISTPEVAAKAAGPMWGWWLAPVFANENPMRQLAKLLAEGLVLVPVGAMWARSATLAGIGPASTAALGRAFALGAGLGLLVEAGQWFMASGVSQGASVINRGAGWVLGVWLWNQRSVWGQVHWRNLLRRWWLPLVVGHAGAVALLSGLFQGPWHTPHDAVARLTGGEVRLVPFYYHYYGSEAAALYSVLAVSMLYAPVALWTWVRGGSPRHAAIAAAIVATLVEAGKLLPLAKRPDVTNPMIAAVAAAAGLFLLLRFLAPAAQGRSGPAEPPANRSAMGPAGRGATAEVTPWLLLPVAAAAALWTVNFPLLQAPLGLLLAAVAAAVWWRPVLTLGIAAAALPVLDLSAWSGRVFVDEFDMIMLVALTTAAVRLPPARDTVKPDRALGVTLVLVATSFGLAAWIGLRPWDPAALSDPGSALSPWHALRLVKGLCWALCLYAILRRLRAAELPVAASFAAGMLVGLAGVVGVVAWERVAFVGLFDMAAGYRVAGPVVAMKLGGAYLDAFLVAALPFALLGAVRAPRLWQRASCAALAVATAYAIGVTFTRTTYLAMTVVAVMCGVLLLRPWPSSWRLLAGASTLILMATAAYPVITGPYATTRMSAIEPDFAARLRHWRAAMALSADSWTATLFGNGLSRYPSRMFLARATGQTAEPPMATHRFVREGGHAQLQLGTGRMLYVDQIVELQPGQQVTLELTLRASNPGARIWLSLCHKWLLSSADCEYVTLAIDPGKPGWQDLATTLSTGVLGGDHGLMRRPVRLTLNNAGPGRIDVDRISLHDASGNSLVANGDFEAGSDFWTYTHDDHLAWHIKNLPLHLWFETGLFGSAAIAMLLGLALWRSGRAAWSGERPAQALAAALAGLLVVSAFDSVVDEPRFLFLVLTLVTLAAMTRPPVRLTA